MGLILRKIIKVFLFLIALITLKSVKWAMRVALEKISIRDLDSLYVKNGELVHKETGLALTDEIYTRIKGGLIYWKSLVAYSGIQHITLEDGIIKVKIDDLFFIIDHPGTLFVLDEIFQERLYDLRVKDDLIVLDIGMNVGVASLYFSKWANVKKVYGFEPLPSTFYQASENIKINSNISDKIIIKQLGVGAFDSIIKVPFERGGSAIFSTNQDFIKTIGNDSKEMVEVEIISIKKIIDNILLSHPEKKILLKLDCEGEEYNILKSLHENDLFEHISCIAMEWHFKGFEELCDTLRENGFSIFNLGRKEIRPQVGMIYAFNMNC